MKLITTTAPADSLALAAKLASKLTAPAFIELTGDLGAGKSVMARGIARGLGVQRSVPSPTFTIARVYPLPAGQELIHFDFYRVGSTDIVATELAEVITDPDTIVMVEWGQNVADVLPAKRLVVKLEYAGETERRITLESFGPKYDKIIEALK